MTKPAAAKWRSSVSASRILSSVITVKLAASAREKG